MEELTHKECTKCHQVKTIDRFNARANDTKKPYEPHCKKCINEWRKVYRQKNLEKLRSQSRQKQERIKADPVRLERYKNKQRKTARKHDYYKFSNKNITQDQYTALLQDQGGVCAICGQPETVKTKRGKTIALAVDHCHTTGKIRGLLCMRCNTRLHLLESESLKDAAQNYLDY